MLIVVNYLKIDAMSYPITFNKVIDVFDTIARNVVTYQKIVSNLRIRGVYFIWDNYIICYELRLSNNNLN